jgi:hypothetical protein
MSLARGPDGIIFVKKYKMIQDILTAIEMDVKHKIYAEQKKLIAVKNLKELLNQIDHEVEVVPLKDQERLCNLLVSLKGQALNDDEYRLVERIATS